MLSELTEQIAVKKQDVRPFLKTLVNNKVITWLVDTGAAVSIVDHDMVKEVLDPEHRIEEQVRTIESATGHRFSTVGKYQIPIRIGEREFPHEVIIVQGLKSEAILGADFFRRYNANIDLKEQTIFFKDTEKIDEVTEKEAFSAIAVKDKTIPAFCESRVQIARTICTPAGTFVATGPGQAAAIIEFHPEKETFTTIRNLSSQPVTIKKGQEVAELELLDPSELQAAAATIHEVSPEQTRRTVPLDAAKKEFLDKTVKLDLPEKQKKMFLATMYEFHDVLSGPEKDLGHAPCLMKKDPI